MLCRWCWWHQQQGSIAGATDGDESRVMARFDTDAEEQSLQVHDCVSGDIVKGTDATAYKSGFVHSLEDDPLGSSLIPTLAPLRTGFSRRTGRTLSGLHWVEELVQGAGGVHTL
ncbi:unnamed protein product [Gadus morhua 'NCC']